MNGEDLRRFLYSIEDSKLAYMDIKRKSEVDVESFVLGLKEFSTVINWGPVFPDVGSRLLVNMGTVSVLCEVIDRSDRSDPDDPESTLTNITLKRVEVEEEL